MTSPIRVVSSAPPPAARSALVVGGGFAGLVAAAALARAGVDVEVLEARTGIDPRFRGELLHPRAVRVLDALGLGDAMRRAGAVAIEGFAVLESPDARPLALPYGSGAHARGLAMDHRAMIATLRGELSGRVRLTVTAGARVTEVVREAGSVVGVRLADGHERRADLVVVAEGRHSRLRTLLGMPCETRLDSFTAAVECVDVSLPATAHGHVFLGAKGPILAYPIGRRRVRMCIDLPSTLEKDRAALIAHLRTHYPPFVAAELRRALLDSLDRGQVELCGNHVIHVERPVAPGIALLGDAAGCCHPLTASGMTLGASDALVLADAIRRSDDLRTALLRYERERAALVRTRHLLTEALYEVFLGALPETRAMRRGLLDYWHGSARARQASIALLAGEDLAVRHFAEEYVRVFGHATAAALRGEDGARASDAAEMRRLATLGALLRLTGEKVEISARALASVFLANGELPPIDPVSTRTRSVLKRPVSGPARRDMAASSREG